MLTDPEMSAALQRWLESPGQETFLRMRALVLASDVYDPYDQIFLRVSQSLKDNRYDKLRDALMGDMPNLLLSPRAHMLLAVAYSKLGARESEEMEGYLVKLCLDGIAGSGDGSFERPYLVTRTEDEYDFLSSKGLERGSQALLQDGERVIDQLTAADGTVLHFDITEPYRRLR